MRVLVADDDRFLRLILARMFARRGHLVAEAEDAAGLLSGFAEFRPELVVSDIEMPGDGLHACRALRDAGASAGFLLMTGSEERAAEAERAGFRSVLRKPFELEQLAALSGA